MGRVRESLRAAAAVVAALLAGCTSALPAGHPRSHAGPAADPAPSGRPGTSPPTTGPRCTDVGSWSTDRLAHQVLVVPALDFDLPALEPVLATGVGGVLLLGGAPAPENLAGLVARADRAAPPGLAPLVMADEEGGGVQRLRPVVDDVPWARQMARTMTPAQVEALAGRIGSEMRAAGVGVDLAPVLDVDAGPGPSAADADGMRSFGGTATTVVAYGTAFMDGLRRSGEVAVVKHFPGLGGASGNTDVGPAATPPLTALERSGLIPFRDAVSDGADVVMVSNASVPGLTDLPASLSSAVIQGLLRTTLGFDGVVATDSLSAGAVSAAGLDVPGAAAAAVEAGADLVLFGSTLTPADAAQLAPASVGRTVQAAVGAVTAAVDHGRLAPQRLRDAARRVLRLKGVDVCPA